MGIKLIGIHGKARSGKDTLASILVEEHGFVRMAFADPLKAASCILFGWPATLAFSDQVKSYVSPLWNMTGRSIFQGLGDAMQQGFGQDFWVKRWAVDYINVKDKHSVVVSDVRTNAEVDMIRGCGGLIIHLDRDGAGLKGDEAHHRSEAGIDFNRGTDIRISNNGSIRALMNEANQVVAFIEQHGEECGLKNLVVEK